MDTFRNVPFGNSVFQILNFTAGKETPQRRYRHCLLQLNQKLSVLKECEFRRKRYSIDIEEIKEKIKTGKGFEKQRLEFALEEKQYRLDIEIKLIEDCMIEISAYKQILATLPEFTREEFEQAEQEYWEKRLLGDARREMIAHKTITPQTIEALENIGMVVGKNDKGQITYTKANQLKEVKHDDILCFDKTDKS